jgi:hypothetical protein
MIKKLKNICTVAAIALVTFACNKVEIKPEGFVDPADAIKTERDVKDALNGAYQVIATSNFYGGRLQAVSELTADRVNGSNLTGYEADIYNLKSNANSGTREIYAEPYYSIQRANTVLSYMDLVSATNKAKFEGEAKFLRAISHFELVKLFAQPYGYTADNSHPGIVIKTSPLPEVGRPRNTVAEVYAQVIKDLNDAQNLLPDLNPGYATKWAAKGYLARVYFQMNKFDSAYKYANDVISSNRFPFDNSANFVTNRFNTSVYPEAVFYLVNDPTSVRFTYLAGDVQNRNLNLFITQQAYNEGTASNDLRAAWYATANGTYTVKKYPFNTQFILPVLHITELKLIRAESAAELNQNLSVAIQDINDITNRAYGGSRPPLASNATAALIKQTVRDQRKLEMIFETGDRLQQIKRIGAKGETSLNRTAVWNCPGMALQFPASEVNVNVNFVPNPTGGCL